MGDGFGLDKAARRAAQQMVKEMEGRLPVELNPALPGVRVAFDWKFFGVKPPEPEEQRP